MKKIFLILALIISAFGYQQAFCATSDTGFIKKFSNCTKFVENAPTRITIIHGWGARKCHYFETSSKETITCAFKQKDLNDITSLMKAQNYSYKNGLSSINGIDKYLTKQSRAQYSGQDEQNNVVCIIEEKDEY